MITIMKRILLYIEFLFTAPTYDDPDGVMQKVMSEKEWSKYFNKVWCERERLHKRLSRKYGV